MRAARIEKPHSIHVVQMENPAAPGPGQVLMKVKMTGICGSDVHIFQGENPFATYPRVFGHEFAGEVAAVGADVTSVKAGDHIIGEPIEYCGQCYACRHGSPNVCSKLKVMGVHIEGGCREYLLLDEKKAHKIDATVPWHVAVLTEPMTIGLQATGRGGVMSGDVVLIMGSGTIGLMNLIAAKSKGAVCIMTDIIPEKLEYAKKLGADHVINVMEENLEERLAQLTEEGPNVVLDCVCNKKSLEQAVDLVSPAGRVVELGFAPITSDLSHVTMMKKEVSVLGTRLQAGKFPGAVALIEKNRDLLDDFVTQRYSIDEVQDAFDFAINRAKEVRKVVVELE